jgi:hypothetical protein
MSFFEINSFYAAKAAGVNNFRSRWLKPTVIEVQKAAGL